MARVDDRWSFANSMRAGAVSGSSSKSRVCARSVRATGFDHALPYRTASARTASAVQRAMSRQPMSVSSNAKNRRMVVTTKPKMPKSASWS